MDEDRTATRLVVLAVVGFALLNYPLLRIADVPVVVLGVPLVWLYVFVVWVLLIVLVALTVRKR
ncbi:MAG TPA: hypothetical protein VFV40_10675 [Nocardioides sp.]|nr:hypothetical protein [Nocardioides sp.]